MALPNKTRLSDAWLTTRQSLSRLTIGGYWALTLPAAVQHNLRWFWLDGLFAAAGDNIYATYLTVYLITLGASGAQIGLMASLSSLSAALLLLPAAFLVEQIGRRKAITLISGGIVGRLALLILALAPWVSGGGGVTIIPGLIALTVLRDAAIQFGYPAWADMTGDIIPAEGRGRYLGSRFMVMNIATMGTTFLAGWMITRAGAPIGYQLALIAAFVLGMISTYCFARLHDPKGDAQRMETQAVLPRLPVAAVIPKMLGVIRHGLKEHPTFAALLAATALWNFSLYVAGPFFTVHLVEDLGANATMVGLTAVATSVSTLAAQQRWGTLVDRWGARRVQTITMLLIPTLPILWIFAFAGWNIILVNLWGGALWGGYNLASFSLLLALAPPNERARYSALYQVVVMASMALGAAAGSLIVARVGDSTGAEAGYRVVFLVSGIGRWIAALLFLRLVRV